VTKSIRVPGVQIAMLFGLIFAWKMIGSTMFIGRLASVSCATSNI
jgi:hypothetical protein